MKPINRELWKHIERLRNEYEPLPMPEPAWAKGDTVILLIIILSISYIAIRWFR